MVECPEAPAKTYGVGLSRTGQVAMVELPFEIPKEASLLVPLGPSPHVPGLRTSLTIYQGTPRGRGAPIPLQRAFVCPPPLPPDRDVSTFWL